MKALYLHFTGGPYHIATAVEQPSIEGGVSAQIYWRVTKETENGRDKYKIACTNNEVEASNFYLKPFKCKYFLIATDPEDPRMGKNGSGTAVAHRASSHSTPSTAYVYKPQRFIRVEGEELLAEIIFDKKKSAFKLKSPYDKKSRIPLSTSQWLPESTLGSRPYFILPRGFTFRTKRVDTRSDRVACYTTEETSDQLLILKQGHKT